MPRLVTSALVLIALAGAQTGRAQNVFWIEERPALTKEIGTLCYSNGDRHVDCGDGTVRDSVTGLVWLQRANCTELPGTGGAAVGDWFTALAAAAALADGICGLSDGSEPGDWRLPTRAEWEATLAHARDGLGCTGAAAPAWTNDAGTACWTSPSSSYTGIAATNYWSATSDPSFLNFADIGQLSTGSSTNHVLKFGNAGIWPVRGR